MIFFFLKIDLSLLFLYNSETNILIHSYTYHTGAGMARHRKILLNFEKFD